MMPSTPGVIEIEGLRKHINVGTSPKKKKVVGQNACIYEAKNLKEAKAEKGVRNECKKAKEGGEAALPTCLHLKV